MLSVYELLQVFMGVIVALLYSHNMYSNGGTGHPPRIQFTIPYIIDRGMLIIYASHQYALHIHHWLLFLPLMSVAIYYRTWWAFGFCISMSAYGVFMFEDSLNIVVDNPWTDHLPTSSNLRTHRHDSHGIVHL